MVEFEWWWLLGFPLFFGLGWIAARIDIRQIVTESRTLPRSYFKGLNFLLNEQPDKAIEAFIEVVKVDPETIELHFALGSLFRRRGEYDRAIRMHQNLLERSDLTEEQRLTALTELGEDYLKAGNLDRAIEHWKRIESQDPTYIALVAQRLLEAYREAGRAEEGLRLLVGYLERYPSLDLLDTVFQQTMDVQGPQAAYNMVRDEVRR